jgi:hypothetical protein
MRAGPRADPAVAVLGVAIRPCSPATSLAAPLVDFKQLERRAGLPMPGAERCASASGRKPVTMPSHAFPVAEGGLARAVSAPHYD